MTTPYAATAWGAFFGNPDSQEHVVDRIEARGVLDPADAWASVDWRLAYDGPVEDTP